jgi:2'-5' RNA ligase
MKTEYHSIWLMPCLEHEERLQAIVQDLAGLFDSPVFQPHLTLVEDMPRACEELQPLLQQVADGVASFDVRVEGIEESPLHYRSFYARFPMAKALREMKQRAVDLFGVGSVETFMPHISLAYGVQESAEKSKVIASLQGTLQNLNVHFDRLCIVSSSQHTPIEDWTIRYDIQL